MDNRCHDPADNIKMLVSELEAATDRLSTHGQRYMGLAKRIFTDHFDNVVRGLKLIGRTATDSETRRQAVDLLDNIRAWNILVEQVGETLVDISNDLVQVFDATALWAATEAEREMCDVEEMENVEETQGV